MNLDRSALLTGKEDISEKEVKKTYKKAIVPLSLAMVLGIIMLVMGILWKEKLITVTASFSVIVVFIVLALYFFYKKT